MSFKTLVRDALGRAPVLDALFRREVWSRVHFPEAEMRLIRRLPATLDIAIDVGAATGSYAWLFNRKAATVFAFEPGDEHYRYLAATVGGTRVEVLPLAVGRAVGTARFFTPGDDRNARHSATLSAANPVVAGSETVTRDVAVTTLDTFAAERIPATRQVDLLKVDVEGHERAVFEGGEQLLRTHKPLILAEIEARHDADYLRTFTFLRDIGYRSLTLQGGRLVPFDGNDITVFQRSESLERRLQGTQSLHNEYLNNFLFEHPETRVKVTTL